jgi:hypothetical protein
MGSDVLGIQPIRNKFLQPNYLFTLQFQEGYLFGRTLNRELLTWDPYDQLGMIQPGSNSMLFPSSQYPSGTNAVSPSNGSVTDTVLAGNQSLVNLHDILYIPTGKQALIHGAIGIKPNYVYCYARYPLASSYFGRWPAVQPPQPANGDQFARFSGYDSPYEDPTDAVELVIPPGIDTSYQFFLQGKQTQTQPLLNLRFAYYQVDIFNPNGQNFEKNLIGAIARRSVPASYLTCGPAQYPIGFGNTNQANNFSVPPITLAQAQALGGS